jgi:MFS family permease
VLVLILGAYMVLALDLSIVVMALPKIHESLGFSTTGLAWVQNAYVLAFGGLLLLGARSGDILGRRRMFIAGIAVFTLASLRAASSCGSPARRAGGLSAGRAEGVSVLRDMRSSADARAGRQGTYRRK